MTKWYLSYECKPGLTFKNRSVYFSDLIEQMKKIMIISMNLEKDLTKFNSNS